jgi:hypothetical protein
MSSSGTRRSSLTGPFTGTNTGPGVNRNRVRISGFEEWTFGDDGLVAESQGHYDQAEYDRQLEHGAPEPG